MFSYYLLHILIIVAIYIILAVSLNLAIGYTGLLNLGHIAFFGVGAYTSAILSKAGVPYPAALFAGGVLASALGLLITYVTRKLKDDYFALATLGFSFIAYSVFLNWNSLTQGPRGIWAIPKPNF